MALYKPAYFLNQMLKESKLKSLDQLGMDVGIDPGLISKMKNGLVPIRGQHILKFHEYTGLPVTQLRVILGDTCESKLYEPPAGRPLKWRKH